MNIIKDPRNRMVMFEINNLQQKTAKAIRTGFYDVGKRLVADAKKAINKQPKHGRVYKLGKNNAGYIRTYGYTSEHLFFYKYHRASAPYEGPASITKGLHDSIDFTVRGSSEMEFGVDQARCGVNYGAFLEYENLISMSGQGSKKIIPRPYLSRAYKDNMKSIVFLFENALNKEYKK